jgi:hypothetical protein
MPSVDLLLLWYICDGAVVDDDDLDDDDDGATSDPPKNKATALSKLSFAISSQRLAASTSVPVIDMKSATDMFPGKQEVKLLLTGNFLLIPSPFELI